MNQFHS